MNKRRIIIKTIILITWMILIFYLSNQSGSESSDLSDGILYSIFKFFNLPDNLIHQFLFVLVRKLAHFTEYLILSILTINLIKEFKVKKDYIISALLCLLYSLTDEIHQLFISNRNGSIFDIIIDFMGVLLGLYIYHTVQKKIDRKGSQ